MQTLEQKGNERPAREMAAILAGRRFGLCGFEEHEIQRIERAVSAAGSFAMPFDQRMLAESGRFCDAILVRIENLGPEGLRAAAASTTPILAVVPCQAILGGAEAVYRWPRDFLSESWSEAELLVRLLRLLDAPYRARIATARPDAAPPAVLIADDDPDMIPLVSITLRNSGIACLTADNGLTALQVAREVNPDLILLDIQMPGLNGFEVLETVRGDAGLQTTRVILLTGSEDPMDVVRCWELRADGFLAKPVSPNLLLNRVKRLLSTDAPGMRRQPRPGPAIPGSEAKTLPRWISNGSSSEGR